MTDINKHTVSIAIGTTMFARYADLPNTVSHAIAEFIDNALQSYRDNKERLLSIDPDFKFKVAVDFEWNADDNRAKTIKISDNAGGLNFQSFQKAFITAETPEDNKGLNEFGMGMKTAAGWLGNTWSVQTTALEESVERFYKFDLQYVLDNDLKELPYTETPCPIQDHYTIITISAPTKNSPSCKSLEKIKIELASVYRQSLRAHEMDLYVYGDPLSFEEYPILEAPFARTPDKKSIYWKKDIDFKFGKYRATGFIAILREINNTQNGLVLLRRGRVIVGAETDGRYFPKSLFGSQGNFRFKRLFGELELEGFEVSFNKNDIQDKENLEALMEALKGEIHTKEFDLYTQADEYRLDENRKVVRKLIRKHDSSAKSDKRPIDIFTPKVKDQTIFPNTDTPVTTETTVIGEYKDTYKIKESQYTLTVQYVSDNGDNLFWVDVSKKNEHEITCKVDTNHIFFKHFGKPTDSVTAILKTLAIAKFTAREVADNSASDMMNYFNQYIRETKI